MMSRGNCNRSSSNRASSNCVRRTSCAASNFKASRQKVSPPRKQDPITTLMQSIHRIDTQTLCEKIKDPEIPESLKFKIKEVIETRQHDEDAAAAAAAFAVIEEQTPQGPPQPARLSRCLIEKLYHKRGQERAKALAGVIELLNQKLDHENLENHYLVELLHRCLRGVKKGSAKEVQYSVKVIGLLSTIVDNQDKMSEIYWEFLAEASTSACLKKAGTSTTQMLECLGVVAFFGAINAEQTQAVMKVIWDCMVDLKSESGSNILVAAINSWLLLLTRIERCELHYWKGAISFFMDLFENNDDMLVHQAASAALALIFEIDSLEKFWNAANDSTLPYSEWREKLKENVGFGETEELSVDEYFDSLSYSEWRETLLEMVLEKLSGLKMDVDVVKYFESPRANPTVCEEKLVVKSWHHLIQLEFLRSFLGSEFENYMAKEDKLQIWMRRSFEFRTYRNADEDEEDEEDEELYKPMLEEITVNIPMPDGNDPETMTSEKRKKERAFRNSIRDKKNTVKRTKERKQSEELNCCD